MNVCNTNGVSQLQNHIAQIATLKHDLHFFFTTKKPAMVILTLMGEALWSLGDWTGLTGSTRDSRGPRYLAGPASTASWCAMWSVNAASLISWALLSTASCCLI